MNAENPTPDERREIAARHRERSSEISEDPTTEKSLSERMKDVRQGLADSEYFGLDNHDLARAQQQIDRDEKELQRKLKGEE